MFRHGVRAQDRRLQVVARRRGEADAVATDAGRFAWSTPSRLGSVARNRIRRRLRAAAQQLGPEAAQNLDIVVNARPPALAADFDELCSSLLNGVQQVERKLNPARRERGES